VYFNISLWIISAGFPRYHHTHSYLFTIHIKSVFFLSKWNIKTWPISLLFHFLAVSYTICICWKPHQIMLYFLLSTIRHVLKSSSGEEKSITFSQVVTISALLLHSWGSNFPFCGISLQSKQLLLANVLKQVCWQQIFSFYKMSLSYLHNIFNLHNVFNRFENPGRHFFPHLKNVGSSLPGFW
jgi:hypothetical protein